MDEHHAHHNMRELKEMSRLLNRAQRIEVAAEDELSHGSPFSPTGDATDVDVSDMGIVAALVLHAKNAAKHLVGDLRTEEEGKTDGASVDGVATKDGEHWPKRQTWKRRNTIIKDALEKAQSSPGGELLAVDMEDVEEMTRQEMWAEIQSLRQQEATMLKVIQQYEIAGQSPNGQ